MLAEAERDAYEAYAAEVRILRDRWGVPHVFGETDAAAAFGLAYAHAEDDWPLIQGTLVAARGELGRLDPGRTALANDFYTDLFEVSRRTDEAMAATSPAFRAVLDGYAAGLNWYAAHHPGEADGRFLPWRARDVLAGFVHKLPLFQGVGKTLTVLTSGGPRDDSTFAALHPRHFAVLGSNAHAVRGSRSPDGVTRLNVNSHQPWEGPVAWYEAHVVSSEGWNMTGGLFPGSPVVLHGHNDHLGWAHTVNKPDLIDVYELVVDDADDPKRYKLGDEWHPLERVEVSLPLDLWLFDVQIPRPAYKSAHGPVLPVDGRYFAVRVAGAERAGSTAEQWYRMNKATSRAEWEEAMSMHALPMFNVVYADADHIGYVYNALLPARRPGYDYTRILPGDRPDALWTDYRPYASLPRVDDPPAGFVQNCNSTPFLTTAGEANPSRDAYPPQDGIEDRMTNRALRSLELFGAAGTIDRATFLRYKFDRAYAADSPLYRELVTPLTSALEPEGDDERRALELLAAWDGVADEASPAAALAVLAWTSMLNEYDEPDVVPETDPAVALRGAIAFLKDHFGRIDVPLGELQRLRRGAVDLAVGGGPDLLHAIHGKARDGRLVGWAGDSYVLLAEFAKDGARSWSLHQYGASNRPESPHYADQAPLFVRGEMRPSLRTEADVRAALAREYHPGAERGAAAH